MVVVGIDEVGRGCWAGPLVAGAVVLAEPINGLKDSKKLSKKQREKLTPYIYEEALVVGLGWVTPAEVDELGLTKSVRLAMQRALACVQVNYDEIIIDGNINFLADNPKSRAVIKADDSVPAVSAASIVAKVARDEYMAKLEKKYPGYGFASHVGYGTAAHLTALRALGASDIHRRSFRPIQELLV